MVGQTASSFTIEILEEDINLLIDSYSPDPLIRAEIKEFYESLKEVDRIVFIMKLQGYTAQEIADYLGVSRRRIRERLERIKKLITDYIE